MTEAVGSCGVRKNHKTYERIIRHIRDAISTGELRPGDRLPPETELARRLDVSRPTVREALKVLEALNVLESSTGPKGGTFIRTLSGAGMADNLRDSITLMLDVHELSLAELWEAREAIEMLAVGTAAVSWTEQDLTTLRDIIESDEHKDFDIYFPDITFHRAIANASGNRLLSLFMLSIHMTLRTLADRNVLPKVPKAKKVSQDHHQLIYEAIRNRDEVLARARMKEHLQMAYQVYQQAIPKKANTQVVGESDPSSQRLS